MMKKLVAIAAGFVLLMAVASKKTDMLTEVRTSFAVGLSMIGVSITNLWAWLPANISLLAGLSGLALTWITFCKVLLEVRRSSMELDARRRELEKDEA